MIVRTLFKVIFSLWSAWNPIRPSPGAVPPIAVLNWGSRPVLRRVVRWVDNVAHGKDDRRQTLSEIKFVEGGTMGPAP